MIRLFENMFLSLEISSHQIGAFTKEHLRLFSRCLFHKLPRHFRHWSVRSEIPAVNDGPVRRVNNETITSRKTMIHMNRLQLDISNSNLLTRPESSEI